MKGLLEVNEKGVCTTVQDKGRIAYQKDGLSESGVMDRYAWDIGNILVGNQRYAASIEMTMHGGEYFFKEDCVIAITGADLSPLLDGKPVAQWTSILVEKGQTLRFPKCCNGLRSYLAIRGGIDVPVFLGSKSTHLAAGLGGYNGSTLQKGDILYKGQDESGKCNDLKVWSGIKTKLKYIPKYDSLNLLRAIAGPEIHAFKKESIENFWSNTYTMTPQMNRMGNRLKGVPLKHKNSADIISDTVTAGTVQVPGNGLPIILLAERQTVGGYTRIAVLSSVDIGLAAQMKSGQSFVFQQISIEDSIRLYRRREYFLHRLNEERHDLANIRTIT